MKTTTTNPIKESWDKSSDGWFIQNAPNHEAIKLSPEMGFPATVYPLLQKYLGNLQGKRVLVPSSGDNVAAFALHLLGAKVTSCDISDAQIKNAAKIAHDNNWAIEFLVQDTMTLDEIPDGEYDLVYTSNGAHVWINDMPGMYKNINRVLKPDGYSLFFETHPIIRPFDDTTYEVKIKQHYADVYAPASDPVPNYHWRTQDFVNAIASSGLVIKEMLEFRSQREDLPCHNYLYVEPDDFFNENADWPGDTFDWKNNPWAALPQCLCICSQKV